jgi:hypothetical protein
MTCWVAGPARQVAVGEMISRSLLPFSGPLHLFWRWPEHEKTPVLHCPFGDSCRGPEQNLDYPPAALVSIGGISP